MLFFEDWENIIHFGIFCFNWGKTYFLALGTIPVTGVGFIARKITVIQEQEPLNESGWPIGLILKVQIFETCMSSTFILLSFKINNNSRNPENLNKIQGLVLNFKVFMFIHNIITCCWHR